MSPGELAIDLFFVVMSAALMIPAVRHYRATADSAAGWFIFTFGTVIALILGGDILEVIGEVPAWLPFAERTIMPIVPLIPYGLYRFRGAFSPPPRRVDQLTLAAAVLLVAWGFVPHLPHPASASDVSLAFGLATLAYWLLVVGYVSVAFWRAGRGQSLVVRVRVRLLSVATGMILFIVVLSGATSGSAAGELTTAVLSVGFFLLLYLGYAPPAAVRSALRAWAEPGTARVVAQLMSTRSRTEVGDVLLPAAADLLGGTGVTMLDRDGRVTARWGDAPRNVVHGNDREPATGTEGDYEATVKPGRQDDTIRFEYPSATIVVRVGPYTPYFGADEIDLVDGICALADMAFARADLLHDEQDRADRADALARSEQEAAERLRQTNELKNEFVAVVAHDLRSPMSVIAGFAEALRDSWPSLDDTQRDHFLEMIILNTQALSRLVEDVLQVARIESGEFNYESRDFDIADVVTRSVEALEQPQAQRVDVSVPDGLIIHGDPDRLWQVIVNMLTNALKFSPAEESVRLNVEDRGHEVAVSVADRGIGIEPGDMGRLFRKFSRLKQPPGTKVKGTGLGLYICKAIVEAHGGVIGATSTPGEGTTFTFTVPKERLDIEHRGERP